MAITIAIGAIGTIVAIGGIGAMTAVVMKFGTIVAIHVIGAIGFICAIGSSNDPLTVNGDSELSIAIKWIKWRHLNGANGDCDRHWCNSPNHRCRFTLDFRP